MSKAKINSVLKQFGLGNIKMQKDYSDFNTQTVKVDGKMVKGMHLRSHSPMDVTSVPYEQLREQKQKIEAALLNSGHILRKDGDWFIFAENSKSIHYVTFHVQKFPTYARCMNLDPGYQTSYLVPYFNKISA